MTQAAIFGEGSRFSYYIELSLSLDAGVRSAIREVLRLRPQSEANIVVAFGPRLWRELAPEDAPEDLSEFTSIDGAGYRAESTQLDLFAWIHGERHDLNVATALEVGRAFRGSAVAEFELHGFVHRDSRDLFGFVDGSANPEGDARFEAAVIPDGRPGAGGSYVLSQQWRHDLEAFDALGVGAQERVIGRTKSESIELEGDAMPADSHVSRTDVKVDGTAMKIYRRSMPYGSLREQGLYFLAFACEHRRFRVQLERMYGLAGDGVHDRLIEFSRAVRGSYWFAPSERQLQAVFG